MPDCTGKSAIPLVTEGELTQMHTVRNTEVRGCVAGCLGGLLEFHKGNYIACRGA